MNRPVESYVLCGRPGCLFWDAKAVEAFRISQLRLEVLFFVTCYFKDVFCFFKWLLHVQAMQICVDLQSLPLSPEGGRVESFTAG